MKIEEAILEKIRELPPDKQQEVLDFSEFLNQKAKPKSSKNLTPQEKVEKWREVLAKLPQKSANLPDEALHRDTMYD